MRNPQKPPVTEDKLAKWGEDSRLLATYKSRTERAKKATRAKTMVKPLLSLMLQLPVEVKSDQHIPNGRGHWAVSYRFNKAQGKELDIWFYGMRLSPAFKGRWKIKLTRLGCTSPMDSDNLARAFKHIRDKLAGWLGVDDRDSERLSWEYDQCSESQVGIQIEIQNLSD